MNWVILAILVIVLLFGFVVFFGAPYLPTRRPQVTQALDLLHLKPGQTLLELGSGDGRVAKAAAQRGLTVIAYELNPILVVVSRLATRKFGDQIRIIWGNYWTQPWPPADGIFVFLHPKYMQKLSNKIDQYTYLPVKLASFAFKIPNKPSAKEQRGVYLYEYR